MRIVVSVEQEKAGTPCSLRIATFPCDAFTDADLVALTGRGHNPPVVVAYLADHAQALRRVARLGVLQRLREMLEGSEYAGGGGNKTWEGEEIKDEERVWDPIPAVGRMSETELGGFQNETG